MLTRAAAATLQLGAANSGTPADQTIQAQGGLGADKVGAKLTIQPGTPTGAGTSAGLVIKSFTPAASSSTAQTPITTATFNGGNVTFAQDAIVTRLLYYGQFTTGGAPSWIEGTSYYDTTLHKLRIGGSAAWETVTSV